MNVQRPNLVAIAASLLLSLSGCMLETEPSLDALDAPNAGALSEPVESSALNISGTYTGRLSICQDERVGGNLRLTQQSGGVLNGHFEMRTARGNTARTPVIGTVTLGGVVSLQGHGGFMLTGQHNGDVLDVWGSTDSIESFVGTLELTPSSGSTKLD